MVHRHRLKSNDELDSITSATKRDKKKGGGALDDVVISAPKSMVHVMHMGFDDPSVSPVVNEQANRKSSEPPAVGYVVSSETFFHFILFSIDENSMCILLFTGASFVVACCSFELNESTELRRGSI